jgi:hypothetical protein
MLACKSRSSSNRPTHYKIKGKKVESDNEKGSGNKPVKPKVWRCLYRNAKGNICGEILSTGKRRCKKCEKLINNSNFLDGEPSGKTDLAIPFENEKTCLDS